MTDQMRGNEALPTRGTPGEVFAAFLKLGLTSFGGPIAHLGYFRDELVTRRKWLGDGAYADLVALCQFLPGPASSQVGFALGMLRAGWLGALAAFFAFTLPSALALLVFAMTAARMEGPVGVGALHGLKIVAVAIVAQAVLGMARTLCPDRQRAAIAVAAVAVLAFMPGIFGMAGAILLGAVAGPILGRGTPAPLGGHVAMQRIARRFHRDIGVIEALGQQALGGHLVERGNHRPAQVGKEVHRLVLQACPGFIMPRAGVNRSLGPPPGTPAARRTPVVATPSSAPPR